MPKDSELIDYLSIWMEAVRFFEKDQRWFTEDSPRQMVWERCVLLAALFLTLIMCVIFDR